MRTILILLAAALASCSRSEAMHPQVIELYQSQGCSSCPPANAVLNELANRKDLITLSFAVTYWDRLGWKDSFAAPAFTQRQYDYARGLGRNGVQTPQMVINGRGAINGMRLAEVEQGLKAFARTGPEPDISEADGKLTIGAATHGGEATVWLVRYEPRSLEVPISAGENAGRTLPHRHIVRQLVALGSWSGDAKTYALPAAPEGLKSAVLVQAGSGGPIIAARAL